MTNNQKTALMIVTVVIAALIMIATVWSIYFFDASEPAKTEQTTASESTSDTETSASETTSDKPSDTEKPKKMIALTFDDGPSARYTHKILDLLEKYDAKATFFVLGNMLSVQTADEIKRAVSLGCEIGNHSYSHPSLTELSDRDILEQITSTNEKIKTYSGCDYECKLYRPPYGNIDRGVMEALYENGVYMHAILWSSDSRDWEYKNSYTSGKISRDQAVQGAFETVVRETSEGTVILMHDIQEITPDILELILKKYTDEGYSFVTVSELFDFENRTDKDSYFYRYRSTTSIVPVK